LFLSKTWGGALIGFLVGYTGTGFFGGLTNSPESVSALCRKPNMGKIGVEAPSAWGMSGYCFSPNCACQPLNPAGREPTPLNHVD
jgi:hypothetical protein